MTRLSRVAWVRARRRPSGSFEGGRDVTGNLIPCQIFGYNGARKAKSGGAGAARMRVSPLATGEVTTVGIPTPPQLPHHKVKIKKAGQRACNEKNEKGKFCGGHPERGVYTTDVLEQSFGGGGKDRGPGPAVYPLRPFKHFS